MHNLSIDQFRNLEPTKLSFSRRLNLFTGANAAGKTSILEALFILGRARSFRTRHLDKVTQTGTSGFQIVAKVSLDGGRVVPVGIRRNEKQLIARMDGENVKRLSDLAALFPIQWVGGNLHQLLEEGPAYRRQFLDWGLFHVEQSYIPAWKRFQKLLRQRNAILRKGGAPAEVAAWDAELAKEGTAMHLFRRDYITELQDVFEEIAATLLQLAPSFEIRYRQGWPAEVTYADALRSSVDKDRDQGFTRYGPQRADLAFYHADKSVAERLSRGQQKLLVTALHIAQAKVLKLGTGISSLFLLDDLGAELDTTNQARVINLLGEIDAQVFATAIELPDTSTWTSAELKRFHVEHGAVSEVV
ncbi:MAG: DNA replication/repair protein RecF [Thiogranum sp.]|nr:DNA replication/repair protein RecF [Thiogranum sp.]